MKQVRSIFISDLHIGHSGLDALAVIKFLQETEAQYIYLVGDIIDGWKLKKRWFWKPEYSVILDQLVEKSRNGTKIIYIPGNHDEAIRLFTPLRRARISGLLSIRIQNICIHKTLKAKKLLVMHGDQFDNFLLRGRVSRWSDRLYDIIGDLFGFYGVAPKVRVKGRLRPFSLAKTLMKRSGKAALKLLNNFERASRRLVDRRNADGLICGHTHVPRLKVRRDGTIFANCGMWSGVSNTALVEELDGDLTLIKYQDCRDMDKTAFLQGQNYQETKSLVRIVKWIWNPRAKILDNDE